jgi:hypothetical protein
VDLTIGMMEQRSSNDLVRRPNHDPLSTHVLRATVLLQSAVAVGCSSRSPSSSSPGVVDADRRMRKVWSGWWLMGCMEQKVEGKKQKRQDSAAATGIIESQDVVRC